MKKVFFNENQLVLTLDKEYANYTKPLKERDDLKQAYDSFRKSYFSNKDSRIKKDFAFYLEKEQAYKKAIDRDIAENLKIDTKRYKQDLEDWLGGVEYLHPVVRNGKQPKIFYHGSGSNAIETFILQHSDGFPKAVWLSPNKEVAQSYSKHFGSVYEVYLKVKNPLIYNARGKNYKETLPIILEQFKKDYIEGEHDALVIKNILDGGSKPDTDILVFDNQQIKAVDNKGSYTDTKGNITKTKPKNKESTHTYFNDKSPNIMYANPQHLGSGIISGSAAGIETDENGNIVGFNPAKFAAGFLGGVAGSKAVAKGLEWRANKVAKSYPNIAKDNPALMSEIAKRDLQTYAVTNTHNALTRFLNNNKLLDVNPQLFAGEKALVNEVYAPHKARLERAKELESSGADEIEIWEKTGWYKDKDKKWKFEISQSGGELKLKYTPEDKEEDWLIYNIGVEKRLVDFLKDDELFKAYPQLQDIKIKTFTHQESAESPSVVGRYEQDKKVIKLNADNIDTDVEKAKSFLYHEIQHAIQDIEGFAYGEKLETLSKDNYRLRHGEVEARNIQERMKRYIDAKTQSKANERYIVDKFGKEGEKFNKLEDRVIDAMMKGVDDDLSEAERKFYDDFWEKNIKGGALGNAPSFYTYPHPHKTMDTPLKDTIAESTMQGEALSKELESSFLDSNGRIDYKALESFAIPLPKQLRYKDFIMRFNNSKKATIQTPIKELEINPKYAFYHLMKNGKMGNKKQDRLTLNGGILETLQKPLFITQDTRGSYYFYKPFKDENGVIHLVSVEVDKNNKLLYKTSYEADDDRMEKMIKKYDLIYFAGGIQPIKAE